MVSLRTVHAVIVCWAVMLLVVAPGGGFAQTDNPDEDAPLVAEPVSTDDFIEPLPSGSVNWQTGAMTAKGIGIPPMNSVSLAQARAMAVRAAVVDARRNLLSIMKGVQIDSTTTLQNAMVESDVVVENVRGFLQNSRILDTAYMSDGSVEVTVGMNIRGDLSSVVLPPVSEFAPVSPIPTPPAAVQDEGLEPLPIPESKEGTEITQEPKVVTFTGLLIDARGLGVRPAMTPKVLDEDGNEVYGSSFVSREYAIRQGMIGYAKDVERARIHSRVAKSPLVVKALAARGRAKTDLVISNSDAKTLQSLGEKQDFLQKCRVMVVLD